MHALNSELSTLHLTQFRPIGTNAAAYKETSSQHCDVVFAISGTVVAAGLALKHWVPYWILIVNHTPVIFVNHAPKGYLVPTPDSIPAGMMTWGPGFSYQPDAYSLEYAATTDHVARLIISEWPASAASNYDGLTREYDLSIANPTKGHHTEKVRDVGRLGTSGILFFTADRNNQGYDLIVKDEKRVLRIEADDGPNFHFSADFVIEVFDGLRRQN